MTGTQDRAKHWKILCLVLRIKSGLSFGPGEQRKFPASTCSVLGREFGHRSTWIYPVQKQQEQSWEGNVAQALEKLFHYSHFPRGMWPSPWKNSSIIPIFQGDKLQGPGSVGVGSCSQDGRAGNHRLWRPCLSRTIHSTSGILCA